MPLILSVKKKREGWQDGGLAGWRKEQLTILVLRDITLKTPSPF
jgi:hypothetical protein